VKVAVLGLGSIGRRHARILRVLGNEVTGFDVRGVAPIEGVRRADSEASALRAADAVIVASPPSEHLRQAHLALQAGAHTLVEKPFAPSADGLASLGAFARKRGLVLRVAMNLRFHPGVSTVHRLLSTGTIGRPLRASVWCGSWLPGWRPGSDYRDTYSAQRKLGGGVLLDAIHELDYALWTLGPVVRVRALLAHVSQLELDVEDLATLVLEHAGGTVTSVALDYLDHAYHRGCRVVGDEGTVHWSWANEVVELYPTNGQPRRFKTPSDVAGSYRAQLEAFLAAAVQGCPAAEDTARLCSAGEAAAALAVADAARRSSTDGVAVETTAPGLTLRAATHEDAADLLRWRNDPATRAASFNGEEVSTGEHVEWLKRVLADPGARLLVAIENRVPVGQLRLERVGPDTVEVHIGLAPEARGRGLATAVLALPARRHAEELGARRMIARIKPENEPSIRSFRRAGFRPDREHVGEWHFELARAA
jgi:predicted dehydrogenase/RimJ/RimL family protein N-acetyltransferase